MSVSTCISYIQMISELMILLILEGLLQTLISSSILTQMDDFTLQSMTNGMILTSELSIFHFSAVTYHLPRLMVFIKLNRYVILVHVHTLRTLYTRMCSLRRNCSNRVVRRKDFKWHSVNLRTPSQISTYIHCVCVWAN